MDWWGRGVVSAVRQWSSGVEECWDREVVGQWSGGVVEW